MYTDINSTNSNNRFHLLDIEGDISQKNSPEPPDILIVGDGNFSFTEALVNRRRQGLAQRTHHKDLKFGSRVLATEYIKEKECLTANETRARVNSLLALGVTFEFGIDATKIHQIYQGRTFKRIQWNCPDGNRPFCDHSPQLRLTIEQFVLASSYLQKTGGKLHMSLIGPEAHPDHTTWQAMHYGIANAVEGSGYVLHSIKQSGSKRYTYHDSGGHAKSWTHKKTSGFKDVGAFSEGVNEFVFKRVSTPIITTPRNLVRSLRGYRKYFTHPEFPPERIPCKEKYYSMPLQEPISSDSESEEKNANDLFNDRISDMT